jgi:dGTPase
MYAISLMLPLTQRITQANTLLAPFAVPHGAQLGRERKEEDDETRFPFQRDRDRIIHSQAFRRLKSKTQVFVANKGDHYRTRLTHTMEVAQISRDMARTMGLNEDLAECIALAHDLGHTPFGHAGEDQMRKEMKRYGGTFEHNLQSLRVVTLLEERSQVSPGLNLNREVLEGLMKHRTSFDEEHGQDIPRSPSLEAQIVNLADEIAYTAHDTDDGLRAVVFTENDLLSISLFAKAHDLSKNGQTEARSGIIHLLVMDAYEETERRIHEKHIHTLEDVYNAKRPLAAFSDEMNAELSELRNFLFSHFYNHPSVLTFSGRGKDMIHRLFEAYKKSPPEKVLDLQKKTGSTLPEAIKDYIAGMTDQYASAKATSIGGR